MSISYGDKSLATLRSLIAVIDGEFAGAPPPEAVRAAWAEMVEVLGVGAAPAQRECPTCGEVGMRAASRCMRCWSRLAVLPALAAPPALSPVIPHH